MKKSTRFSRVMLLLVAFALLLTPAIAYADIGSDANEAASDAADKGARALGLKPDKQFYVGGGLVLGGGLGDSSDYTGNIGGGLYAAFEWRIPQVQGLDVLFDMSFAYFQPEKIGAFEFQYWHLPILAGVRYRFLADGWINPYAKALIGISYYKLDAKIRNNQFGAFNIAADDDGVSFSVKVSGGVIFQLEAVDLDVGLDMMTIDLGDLDRTFFMMAYFGVLFGVY